MNIGQRVMTIATWYENPPLVPPPIGSTGTIHEPLDSYGEYYVLFDDFPCPTDHEPEWVTPHWALIPIDDDREMPAIEREETVTC
jgi:hypothetical protein